MDAPRRGTMLPTLDPLGNARSNIPQPSTIKKPTSSILRQSMAGPQAFFNTSRPRNSLYPSQNLNVPPSAQKASAAAYGRTPMRNSVRGGSQWGSGRQSMAPPTPAPIQPVKDPRNIRDKPVQQAMRTAIFNWLQESQIQATVSRQTLLSPTAKDFRAIFEHLVGLLDPTFVFGEKGKKFEDEVIPILKAHHYPFADALDKRWLAAPASMHSWPSLTAMLHWLSELSRARMAYLHSGEPTLQDPDQVPEDFDDPNHHTALAFQYHSDAYGVFLSGLDDFREQDQFLEERYARKDEGILSDLEALKTELQTLSIEYQHLTESQAPIVLLEEQNRNMKQDKKKFDEFLTHIENRKRKILDAIKREEKEIAAEAASLHKLREEQERLSVIVREQNLSPEEVSQMNSEQESLTRTLDELRKKNTETSNQMRSLEVSLAKRSENVEQAIDEYTEFLDKLGLFPTVPPPLAPTDIRLEINFASANPRDLIRRTATGQGADLRNEIKPVLDAVADYKRHEYQRLEDEVVTVEQELDEVTVEADKIEDENLEVDRRTANVHEEAEAIRIATQQEALVSNGEAVRLQKELAHARTVALANGVGVKSRLQALQIAYQEQIERVDRLKDETVRMIMKSSSDIAAFKEEVSGHLDHLRQFAEEN